MAAAAAVAGHLTDVRTLGLDEGLAAGILESKPFVMGAGGVPTDQWPTPHES